ncbi:UNVERIFIED_CONTAM: Phosphatidylinositol 5-phosphate 4-kinase type-2 alpha [Gekko kuhli]
MAAAAAGNIVSVMASKTKTKKKHFVAQKVKLFRASDPLLSVLMWGVNHSDRCVLLSSGKNARLQRSLDISCAHP